MFSRDFYFDLIVCCRRLLIIAFGIALLNTVDAQTVPLRGYLAAHDPSTIIQCKNRYYLFYTGQGIASKSSADKIFWSPGPAIFTNPPAWTSQSVPGFTGLFWAPDILFFNNRYYLYYAVSAFGSQVSAIGLATNPTLDPTDPTYQWTDQGMVIASTNGSPYNTIDPSFCWDNLGRLWMAFGSYWNGIYLTQLNPTNGLGITGNQPVYHLAYNSSIEASYLCRRGGYYYLFVNWGSCCSGVESTYNIRVGRSTSITGPYLDRQGIDMAAEGGTLFLQGSGKFCGPGHVGIMSENGSQWFSYHYYDANAWALEYNSYGSADFNFVPLSWTADDWPIYTNNWSAIYNFQGDVRDLNGQYSGLLAGGATIITDSKYGHTLNLNGTNQYVWLPPGVANAETFVAVVNWRGGSAWQRIFDFGYDTTRTIMLTPASGDGVLRCDINPGESLQTIQWTSPLPTNAWTQVAVTLDGTRGVLYLNGLPVATNNAMTFIPLNVAAQTNTLGRSKFSADPYFNGRFASFRVYSHALSPSELIAPLAVIRQPENGSKYAPGGSINYAGSATDFTGLSLPATNLTWQISYVKDGLTNIVFGPLTESTSGTFNIPITSTEGAYLVTLIAIDAAHHQSTANTILYPAHPASEWSSYYPLKSDANDANGHYSGKLNGGASFTSDPMRGNVLNLSGTNEYVIFPSGLSGMQTFMAWINWSGGAAWQRIYDFGNDTNHYSVLTPAAANGKLRFNISVNSTPGEQIIDAPFSLRSNVWTHVAVVMNGNTAILYTNGVPIGTNGQANLVPANLAATNIYIGKSQWPADPYFAGKFSSIRIFSRALSPAEIVSPQITITQPAQGGVYNPGDKINFSGGANDFYDTTISAAGLTWTINFISMDATNIVFGPRSSLTSGTFNIPNAEAAATNGFYEIILIAVDTMGRAATNSVRIFPSATSASVSSTILYPFTNNFADANGYHDGTPKNGASIQSDPARGKVLSLAGIAKQYVNLPSEVSTVQTIAGWVKWSGGNSWQRIFDFGLNTNQFFYLTPADGNNLPQISITPNLNLYNQTIGAQTAFPVSQWTHVAVVMNGREGLLYLNGQAVAVNNSVNLLPSDIGATNCNFGKSQFASDPSFNGRLSDVSLGATSLLLSQIIAPSAAITQPTTNDFFSGGQTINFAGIGTDYSDNSLSGNSFVWSGEFHSNGIVYKAFEPVTNVTNGSFNIATNQPVSTNLFYRVQLAITDTNGYQQTASVDLPPQMTTVNLDTVPTGLQLAFDGALVRTPSNLDLVTGYAHLISAPATQSILGIDYNFVLWSDEGDNPHSITISTNSNQLIASYVLPALQIESASQSISVSWPVWAASMNLYSASNLKPPVNWLLVTNAASVSKGRLNIQLPANNQDSFFRLHSLH